MRHVLALLLLLFSGALIAQVSLDYVATPTCPLFCSGAIQLTPTSGAPPYSYQWSDLSGPQNRIDLCAGLYSVTVTDGNGDTGTANIVVPEDPPIVANTYTMPECGTGFFTVVVNVTGGTPPYTVVNPIGGPVFPVSDNDFFLPSMFAGTYEITITDAIGCITTTIVSVPFLPPFFLSLTGDCSSITAIVTGGVPPYNYIWTGPNGFSNSTAGPLNSLEPGLYTLQVTDGFGCTLQQSVTISSGFDVHLFPCGNDIYSQVTGNSGSGLSYLWSNNQTSPTLTDVTPGTYSLSVTDDFGCLQMAATILGAGDTCPALVQGLVYRDNDINCINTGGDNGLDGVLIKADGMGQTVYTTTDVAGNYSMPLNTEGNYTLSVMPWSALWSPCINDVPVVAAFQNTVTQDFGLQASTSCPLLDVDITAPFLRRCFTNVYTVHYCNYGTADATNASVQVNLDPFMSIQASSIPAVDLGNNVYSFDVGDIPIGDCGSFTIQFYLACNAYLGQNHCTEAHIFPDDNCFPDNPLWDGSNVDVNVSCVSDSVAFLIQNTGTGDMQAPLDYLVVEDQIILMTQPFQLNQGEQLAWKLPAEGMTYFLLAEQSPGNPSNSTVAAWNEGCNGSSGTGAINLFPTGDEDPYLDIDCQNNIGSYDPNDKQGFPLGLGDEHYILRGTDLEYLIRFQNTGTDTAFTVVVRDTLSPLLDITSIRPGAASHNYDFKVYGDRIVEFRFNNILLPDSTTNEAASHGFVAFRVKPVASIADGTQVHNEAGIYFDLNDPVVTNQTTHTIVEKFQDVLPVAVSFVPGTQARFQVYPNPMSESTSIELEGQLIPGATLTLNDSRGVTVRSMSFEDGRVTLHREGLTSGLYWAVVRAGDGRVVGVARVVVADK